MTDAFFVSMNCWVLYKTLWGEHFVKTFESHKDLGHLLSNIIMHIARLSTVKICHFPSFWMLLQLLNCNIKISQL